MKRVEIMRIGERFPAKKKGKIKNVTLLPRFKRATPKPRMMNPAVIKYSSLFFKQNSPSIFGHFSGIRTRRRLLNYGSKLFGCIVENAHKTYQQQMRYQLLMSHHCICPSG